MSRNNKSLPGFTLFELMIAITIIAILTAIGVPAYQHYVQKAAMTDMLQASLPYKMSVEFCAFENNDLSHCKNDHHGILPSKETSYVSSIIVENGSIKLTGKSTLSGLIVTLTPQIDSEFNQLSWAKECKAASSQLQNACSDIFK